jgi:hypothetical protein
VSLEIESDVDESDEILKWLLYFTVYAGDSL